MQIRCVYDGFLVCHLGILIEALNDNQLRLEHQHEFEGI